ncbi:hypothetical protein [Pendulispora albinea]|uniref:Cytochrome C Planctomycete-type domain-containing protein n=1 Tax=Pendulispora albinea TaxID=2741071 RepID=A0ABZ2LQT5_9BACT
MRRGKLFIAKALAFVAFATCASLACLPEQERTNYGPAESLGPRQFPGPKNPAPAGDGGTPPLQSLCGGKGPIDGGPCDTSWKKDIFEPMFKTAGTMKCSSGTACHGDNGTSPIMSDTDPEAARAQLALFIMPGNKKPYIDVCGKDPDGSGMVCNLGGACGSQMPKTSTGQLATAAQMETIRKWLACGAPNN